MAASFPAPSALNVGTYFVQQYYQVLQQHPDLVHQFYTEASTVIRVDGNATETASSILGIHELICSLNFKNIEIKTANSQESWNAGVLVMVSGSVQTQGYSGRRSFVQTFFLAPQEKGYFILNDIFHFLDEEQIHQHATAMLAHNSYDAKLSTHNDLPESVSEYTMDREIQAREFVASAHAEENDSVDKYSLPEQQQQQFYEADKIVEETPVEVSTTSFSKVVNPVQETSPVPVEEPVGEPTKHTYASILRAKGHSAPSATQQSTNRSAPPVSEWHHSSQPIQQSYPATSMGYERSSAELLEDVNTPEEEGDVKSVYVRNLPSTISSVDIEQEFKNFGLIKPEGVVIRNRKDIGVCYAFVEFEDTSAVQKAIKASPLQLGGRMVHIEERRPSSSSASRGGRRGRGRGSYPTESTRGGHFGGRGRGSGQEVTDRDYNRARGSSYNQRVPRQDRGILGNNESRNGQNSWGDDAAY